MTTETLLIVDDSPANLRPLLDYLSQYYRILVDTDGYLALKTLEEVLPDLILLDVMMPGLDGFEFCRRLKGKDTLKDIPIIFMTSLTDVIDEVHGLELGAVDYITKPFEIETVFARIKTHLTLHNLQKQLELKNQQLELEIVQRQHAEASLLEANDALELRVDELSSLNYIIQMVASVPQLNQALQLVALQMLQLFQAQWTEIALLDNEQTGLVVMADCTHGDSKHSLQDKMLRVDEHKFVQKVLHSKAVLLIDDIQTSDLTSGLHPLMQARDTTAMMVVPLLTRGEAIGLIWIELNQANSKFSMEQMALAETIAGQIAGAIDNARLLKKMQEANQRMKHELDLAREIQQGLLQPPKPHWPQLDVLCHTSPAQEVGGDFYAYHAFNNERVLLSKHILAVGDVSGKGPSAALLMAASLSRFEASLAMNFTPAERMAYLDTAIRPYTQSRGQNCALCYIEIVGVNTQQPVLRIVNAGCIPPYIKHVTGEVTWPECGGLALGQGVEEKTLYEQYALPLSKGDIIVLTSDGVVEAQNEQDELFGFDRLYEAVTVGPNTSVAEMMAHLQAQVKDFMGQAEAHDDLTLIVIQI